MMKRQQECRSAGDVVRVGMVGCGAMGRSLGKHLVKAAGVQVVAMFDPDPRAMQTARAELAPDARLWSSYDDMLAQEDLDWVLIASWNCFHAEQTIAAFRAGKHVFCQKPLATNLEDCLQMADVWRRSACQFNLGLTLRYSPHYRKIHSVIQDGLLGRIISMEFNETLNFNHGGYIMGDWRRRQSNAGTHLLEKCCHDVDLAAWMTGSRAMRVASFGGLDVFRPEHAGLIERASVGSDGTAYMTWQGPNGVNPFTSDKDIIDNQVVILEYENGVRATFHTNCNTAIPERRMLICGTEGTLRADVITGKIELCRIGLSERKMDISTDSSGGHGGGDEVLVDELVTTMCRGNEPVVGIREGLESAITCMAIDHAMERGDIVSLGSWWRRADAVLSPAAVNQPVCV